MWRLLLAFFSSTRLTLACLVAAMLLVLAGTLAQVHLSAHEAQARYFQSLLVWSKIGGVQIPVFPGGHLVGALLMANLLAAAFWRVRPSLRSAGLYLVHGGLIVLLAGGLLTDWLAVESRMLLREGETRNYSEDARRVELVFTDGEREIAIPETRLRKGGVIPPGPLPFQIVLRQFYNNSQLFLLGEGEAASGRAANRGLGLRVGVRDLPAAPSAESGVRSALVEMMPPAALAGSAAPDAPWGTWLVSEAFPTPQTVAAAGTSWRMEMRPVRYYKPYSFTLRKFTHERHPGTEIPKHFSSQLLLDDPARSVRRDVLISMNNPLRYGGESYYQSGFGPDGKTTILQVVKNPGFIAPYIGCVLMTLGLLVQFGTHLLAFTRKTHQAAPSR